MLWNMPYMRRTNAAFVAWILSQTNGLYFFGAPWWWGRAEGGRPCVLLGLLLWHLCISPGCLKQKLAAAWAAGYGPVDQGAFNQYYEKEIRGKPINKVGGRAGYREAYQTDRQHHG